MLRRHGFQFVSVTPHEGATVDCVPEAFTGVNIHSTVEQTSNLEIDTSSTDGSILSRLQSIVLAGQVSNLVQGMPTDCPTREKVRTSSHSLVIHCARIVPARRLLTSPSTYLQGGH